MKIISKPFSFEGWEFLKFLRGRKKLLIILIGSALGYIISDSILIASLSGPLADMIIGIAEFYAKEYRK